MKVWQIDVHPKYDQRRRGHEAQGTKYLPRSTQRHSSSEKRWLTTSKITHSFSDRYSVSPSIGDTRGYDAHLTVDWGGGIESNHVKYQGHQGADAGQRINLLRGVISTGLWAPLPYDGKKCGTDPYCPSVWAIPSDNAPFIIESGEELPSERGNPMAVRL